MDAWSVGLTQKGCKGFNGPLDQALLRFWGLVWACQPIVQVTVHAQILAGGVTLAAALTGGTLEQNFE